MPKAETCLNDKKKIFSEEAQYLRGGKSCKRKEKISDRQETLDEDV